MLRLDPKLWEELNAWASQELRSVNGQIEFLLREAVRQKRKRSFNLDGAEDEKTDT